MIRDFESRHIGPNASETAHMLNAIGVNSLDELIDKTIPASIRRTDSMKIAPALSEYEYLQHILLGFPMLHSLTIRREAMLQRVLVVRWWQCHLVPHEMF